MYIFEFKSSIPLSSMTVTVQPVCTPCYLIIYIVKTVLFFFFFLLKWVLFSSHFPKSVAADFVSYWIRSEFQAMAAAQNLGVVELLYVQEKDLKFPLESKKLCMMEVILRL